MITAIYPGTFDPMTLGHEDLARRAAKLFDRVIVGVADSPGKRPFFTPSERVGLAADVMSGVANVTVTRFSGLLTDFVRSQQSWVIVRGLRAVSDFEYEFQLAGMNRKLFSEIETVFLTPSDAYMFVSATLVREIALMGGDIAQFVSPLVAERVAEKLRDVRPAGRPQRRITDQ
ncbi:MAG: pantetheine-phosphate adenylyltransferase [Proteobacteria bacterium]|nr:pantetheine-phosphate adenylyltransferase [Burkholderiales bacterium]